MKRLSMQLVSLVLLSGLTVFCTKTAHRSPGTKPQFTRHFQYSHGSVSAHSAYRP